jgi:hypothetical protein
MTMLPRPLRSVVPCFALLVAAAGCSSSSGSSSNPDGGSGSTAIDAFWCPTATAGACGIKSSVCGVCVANPLDEAARTSGWVHSPEYSGSGPVDRSCFDASSPALAPLDKANSKTVNMRGWVKIFANGPDSKGVKVDVYKEGANGALGDLVGSGQSISDGTLDAATATFADGGAAGMKIELITVQGQVEKQQRKLYPFEIKGGIPTETPLIVRTSGLTPTAGWLPLYDYNIIARNTGLVGSGTNLAFNYDVRALGNDDYVSILKAAYNRLPDPGMSAIAGEVHDCGDVRIKNATVGVTPNAGLGLFYLTDIEDNPLPQSSLKSTAGMGLYAAGAMNPGSYTVASLAKVNGKTVTMGTYTVQTFPDAVTAVSFRGLRPWQVPTK